MSSGGWDIVTVQHRNHMNEITADRIHGSLREHCGTAIWRIRDLREHLRVGEIFPDCKINMTRILDRYQEALLRHDDVTCIRASGSRRLHAKFHRACTQGPDSNERQLSIKEVSDVNGLGEPMTSGVALAIRSSLTSVLSAVPRARGLMKSL